MKPLDARNLPSPLGLTHERFGRVCEELGVCSAHVAKPVYSAILREGITDGSGEARGVRVELPPIVNTLREDVAEGTTVKFITRLPAGEKAASKFDHLEAESVLIPMIGRSRIRTYTLCVSSQIGCAMGCGFCETAQMGLIRSLTADEIVAQWFHATHTLGCRPSNIVFMGMGEPLDNLDNVLDAVAVLKDQRGPGVPISKITISTVGRVDGLEKLGQKLHEPGWHRLNLALSLNAPNDTVRDALMPINRKYNLAELQRALKAFPLYGGGKICVEYVLIPGVNDAPEHVDEVAEFLAPINEPHPKWSPRAMINLIPYNPRRNSPWPAPSEDQIEAFLGGLIRRGVFAKRRRTKGRAMMGACGQLGNEHIRGRKPVSLTISADSSSV
ncbi:MAG: 23S rRNA (adenine(2503)-C(2))-methyltransferase RlmN [Planctomycetota bacterium]|nr:23S rRNA (adenine(2503)-C(2))-methyltransferase RlmN [Planctomycetota bacterium]